MIGYVARMLTLTLEVMSGALGMGWLELTPHAWLHLQPTPVLYAVQMLLLLAFYLYICYINFDDPLNEKESPAYDYARN